VSSVPGSSDRYTLTDPIAGLLAAASIAISGIAFVDRPGRLAPVAVIVAFLAGRMSVRFQRLGLIAAMIGMLAFVVGMSLAVVTEHPII
jgi:hypothetical protein